MKRRWSIVLIVWIALIYFGSIVLGLRIKSLSFLHSTPRAGNWQAWEPMNSTRIPRGARGDSIRRGILLFDETPIYAAQYTSAQISCTSCHIEGGISPYASPMVGLPALFPMYNQRAGHMISLRDRIQECFVRSENGRPLSYTGPEMQSLVDYIVWLSEPQSDRKPFVGRGLIKMPDMQPDIKHGSAIYAEQCAGCHGQQGEGNSPEFPPLWGSRSFNDGAGMNDIRKMAAFVQHNMPQNRKGILSPQDAVDVSAFIHTQSRPAFNPAYKKF